VHPEHHGPVSSPGYSILDAGVEPLGTSGRVDMRRVTGKEHAPHPVSVHHAYIRPE